MCTSDRTARHIPLPPYIARGDEPADRERYQRSLPSGLGLSRHPPRACIFPPAILDQIKQRGMEIIAITLDVAWAPFQRFMKKRLNDTTCTRSVRNFRARSDCYLQRATRCPPNSCCGNPLCAALEDCLREINRQAATKSGSKPGQLLLEPDVRRLTFLSSPPSFSRSRPVADEFSLAGITLLVLVSAFAGRELILRSYVTRWKRLPLLQLRGCMWIR